MDGSKLLEELLGSDAESLGERAKQEHDRRYRMMEQLLTPFDGARDLLRVLHKRGIKVVLATSAPPDELKVLRRLLDVEDAVDAVTNADDVETAKPSPDIVSVGLERVGVQASEAIFVGDAVWDVRAANAMGVVCIGVTSGGLNATELRDAGAAATFDDVAALLADLDGALLTGR